MRHMTVLLCFNNLPCGISSAAELCALFIRSQCSIKCNGFNLLGSQASLDAVFSILWHSQMQGYFFQTSFQAGQLIYRLGEVAQPLSPNFVCLCQMAAYFNGFKMAFSLFQSKSLQ